MLDESKYSDIADLITQLKTCVKIGNAESIGAGTFFMITHTVYDNRAIYLKQKTITQDQAVEISKRPCNIAFTRFTRCIGSYVFYSL